MGLTWRARSICAPGIALGPVLGLAAGFSVFETAVSTHLLSRNLCPPPRHDERERNLQAMSYCCFEPPSLTQWVLAELAGPFALPSLALHHRHWREGTALSH